MNLKIEDLEKNDGKKKKFRPVKTNTDVMVSEERSNIMYDGAETDLD